ncbi:MAG: autoinducer binding domain-containing protein [Rhodospirillaceae bacterium]
MIRSEISNILEDLESADSRRSFEDSLSHGCEALGYNTYAYFSINAETILRSKLTEAVDDMIRVTNLDPSWMEHYVKQNYAMSDPVVMDALKARMPVVWTEDYRFDTLSSDEAQMMADAHDFGIERGLTVPIHGPSAELGMLCLYSDMRDREFASHVRATKSEVLLVAQYAHNVAQTTLPPAIQTPKPVPLTDREIEILRWTAEGKTAWEIGSILTISERTVNFHLQNAMGKFGVHNKTHAASKAMSSGLL